MNNPTPAADLYSVVRFALAEDIGSGDVSAELIPAANTVRAKIISRDQGILCGGPWVNEIFNQVDPALQISWETEEGSGFEREQVLAVVSGSARHILTAERTALNFLQTLSATATQSHRYASLVAHTQVRLLDTRKTLPGLRSAQKYAVRVGGCYNHRMGLFDAFLIKENHISACGGIVRAIKTARSLYPAKAVEIEVQNLAELEQALSAEADTIMLDNFGISQIKKAVAINGGRSKLEASGGIGENTLVNIAETGVDYISIGSLTKDCKAIDLSLLLE